MNAVAAPGASAASCRLSLTLYNNADDVDRAVAAVREVSRGTVPHPRRR